MKSFLQIDFLLLYQPTCTAELYSSTSGWKTKSRQQRIKKAAHLSVNIMHSFTSELLLDITAYSPECSSLGFYGPLPVSGPWQTVQSGPSHPNKIQHRPSDITADPIMQEMIIKTRASCEALNVENTGCRPAYADQTNQELEWTTAKATAGVF